MGFGNLRVINEDRITPGSGFGTHGHRDMEIVSYVLSGALAHRDSLGTGSSIEPGEVQCMSAGTGIRHSEHNHLADGHTHFLQIWFLPDAPGGDPGYEQRRFSDTAKRGRLCKVVSRDGTEGSLRVRADVRMYAGLFDGDEAVHMPLDPSRLCYVHVARGSLTVNGHALSGGDALMMSDEASLSIHDGRSCEVLVFDLAR